MQHIDLTLLQEGHDTTAITAVALSPLGNDAFTLTITPELLQSLKKWKQILDACYKPDPDAQPRHNDQPPAISTHRQRQLRHSETELRDFLHDWLQEPQWIVLQRLLAALPGLPLRLRLHTSSTQAALIRLPWETLRLDRPIWRLATRAPQSPISSDRPIRRPRLLLLVGDETHLQLDAEVAQLQRLQTRGGLELTILRGPSSSPAALAAQLRDPHGWDVLAYLGHSKDDQRDGGRLRLSDGSWLSGQQLRQQLEHAALPQRPALVLLNSCLGLDLANSCLAAGVAWVVCFRDKVPDQGASQAFGSLLQQLLIGQPLTQAVATVQRQLSESGPAGCALQLSAVSADTAPPLQLPLDRSQRFRLRLASSRPSQLLVAVIGVCLALAMDVAPTKPPSSYLLDRRLWLQWQWRQLTRQPGPNLPALPVLLLDDALQDQLGPSHKTEIVSRPALAAVLRLVNPAAVPVIGLDVVLDEAPDQEKLLLEQLIRQQQRLTVIGYFGEGSDVEGAGRRSQQRLPSGPTIQQGDVQVTTDGTRGSNTHPFPEPLQLVQDLQPESFAARLAQTQAGNRTLTLPSQDTVIDWSLNWRDLIRVLPRDTSSLARIRQELQTLKEPLFLIGTNGRIQKETDLFWAPSALIEAGSLAKTWGGNARQLPGPVLQAVLIQSLRLQHWLTPVHTNTATALTAGLGVLLAAGWSRRRQRLPPLLLLSGLAIPLTLQLAISQRILVPLVLPLVTLTTITLIRRD